MKRRAYAKRRDANEPEIVAEFRRLGCDVEYCENWDLDVLTPSKRRLMVEVKTDTGRLTKKQEDYILRGWPLHIVRSAEDARELIESEEFVA